MLDGHDNPIDSGGHGEDATRCAIDLAPVERVLLWTDRLQAVDFDCAPSHPYFRGSGPLSAPCVAWAKTPSSMFVDGYGELIIEPSELVFLPAGVCYERQAIGGYPDVAEVIALPPDEFLRRVGGLGVDPGSLRPGTLPVPANALLHVRACFASLRGGAVPRREAEAEASDLVESAFCALVERQGLRASQARRVPRPARHLVERARVAALDRRLGGSPLHEVAGELGVSPEHLCRLSRQVLGMPFGQYVADVRLRRALDLMQRSNLGLLDIALECGFSSHPHFSNAFRRKFGHRPSKVRPMLQPAKAGRARTAVRSRS